MSDENKTIEDRLEEFGKVQHAILVRLEAKMDNLEAQIAALLTGYVDVVAVVEALVEDRTANATEEELKQFTKMINQSRAKVLETLDVGRINAENNSEAFTSHFEQSSK